MKVYKVEFYITEKYKNNPKINVGYKINSGYTHGEGEKLSELLEYKDEYKAICEFEKYIKSHKKWLKDRIKEGLTRAEEEKIISEMEKV